MEDSILIRNLTVNDLQNIIRTTMREEIQILLTKKGDPRYLTRKEAAELLKISLPTLHEYTRHGLVKGFRIGNRILYKLEDLEQDLKIIEVNRYRRSY
jgi:excisionase family DNA binding protein